MIYRNIRIDSRLHGLLIRYKDSLQATVNHKPEQYPDWLTSGRVTVSAALRYLLYKSSHRSHKADIANMEADLLSFGEETQDPTPPSAA